MIERDERDGDGKEERCTARTVDKAERGGQEERAAEALDLPRARPASGYMQMPHPQHKEPNPYKDDREQEVPTSQMPRNELNSPLADSAERGADGGIYESQTEGKPGCDPKGLSSSALGGPGRVPDDDTPHCKDGRAEEYGHPSNEGETHSDRRHGAEPFEIQAPGNEGCILARGIN